MASGGYKGASPARETSPEQYPGVWELTEQFQAQADGNWPFQADDCAPKSLRIDRSSGAYLAKTPTAAGNRRVFTFSCWYKRTKFGTREQIISAAGSTNTYLEFQNDQLMFEDYTPGANILVKTNRVFRDPMAFYSIVLSVDTRSPVASDRVKIFVNGVQETSLATANYGSQNYQTSFNSTGEHKIGQFPGNTNFQLDGLLSDVYLIDGQALSCEEFGFFDGQGIWQPKRFTGDYATGTVWSNYLTATNGGFHAAPYNEPAGFNGFVGSSSGGYVQTANGTANPNSLTFTPPTGIPYKDKVEVWLINSANTVSVNGGAAQSIAGTQWVQVATGPGTLTSIKFERPSTNGASFGGIRIDGMDLVDPSVGRNSFHLEFEASADRSVKDSSGLGNDWTANNLHVPGNAAPAYYTADALYTDLADVLAYGTNHGQSALTLSAAKWVYLVPGAGGSAGQRCHPDTPFSGSTYMFSAEEKSGLPWTNVGGYGTTLGEIQNFVWVDSVGADHGYRYSSHVTHYVISDGRGGSSSNWQPASDGDWASGTTFPALLNTANNNPALGDTSVDSPVNGNEASTGAGGERRGNYATLNSITPIGSNCSFSNGNLDVSVGSSSSNGNRGIRAISTIGMTSGKWYCEHVITGGSTARSNIGVINNLDYGWDDGSGNYWIGRGANDYIVWSNGGAAYTGSAQSNAYGVGWGVNDVIGCAFDADEGKMYIYKNGTVMNSGTPSHTGLTDGPYFFIFTEVGSDISVNFGQRPFKHPVSGYSPLATSFMPEPAIKRGDEAATVALYTGNQGGQTVENLRISPDLVWIKNRSTNPSSGHYWHIHDTVRGKTGSFYNALYTNGSESENTYAASSYGGLSDITDDGFTLSPAAGYSPAHLNANGTTYAAFCWDAGETTTTIAAGGLNSSAYDQSQTWSTSGTLSNFNTTGTYDFAHLFNGVLGTDTPGTDNQMTSPSGGSGTWTYTINNVTEFKIRLYVPGSTHATANSIKINGSDIVQAQILDKGLSNDAWHTVTVPGITTFSSLFVEDNYWYVSNIYINGKELVDNGVSVTNVPSIATTVRARPETGFSIATYTGNSTGGATVAHGFNKKPDFFMIGCRNVTNGNYWDVWHSAWYVEGTKNYMRMCSGSTNGAKYAADMFQTPTALVNTLGSSSSQNGTNNYVMYSWTAVEGYSAFGEFMGVGSESTGDGPFVFCGFKPAVILWKPHSVDGGNWFMVDTSRHPNNVNDAVLRPNTNGAETDSDYIDVLSNGFKVRATPSLGGAGSGYKFLYAAWAENPFGSQTRAN